MPGSAEEFMLPGFFKVSVTQVAAKKVPAIKKGAMVANPFKGGEEAPHAGRAAFTKPATVKIKIRPLAKMKAAALGK